jgi:hypothetical protein
LETFPFRVGNVFTLPITNSGKRWGWNQKLNFDSAPTVDAPTSKEVGFLIHRDTLQFPGIHFLSTPEGILSKSVDYSVRVRPTLQFRNLNCLGFTGTPVRVLTFLERLIAPLVNESTIAEISRSVNFEMSNLSFNAPYIQRLKTLGFTAPFYKILSYHKNIVLPTQSFSPRISFTKIHVLRWIVKQELIPIGNARLGRRLIIFKFCYY